MLRGTKGPVTLMKATSPLKVTSRSKSPALVFWSVPAASVSWTELAFLPSAVPVSSLHFALSATYFCPGPSSSVNMMVERVLPSTLRDWPFSSSAALIWSGPKISCQAILSESTFRSLAHLVTFSGL